LDHSRSGLGELSRCRAKEISVREHRKIEPSWPHNLLGRETQATNATAYGAVDLTAGSAS
jgi:hypothetical protein